MNFVGKFDAKLPVEGSAAHPVAFAHVDGASTHAPSDAIIVPDAQLLFGGDFKRSGVDLVLSKDDHELVLHDYFKGEKRAALASPDGAHLTGDLVNALTGHVEYAQADGAAAAAVVVVGHVTKLTGSATAIRNGVSIILNQGDNIDKGDVLQSGADSTLGVTFIDGTVFGMSSNARMVVNEMVYDPNGSNNSSLLSLVAGTISFVAGETAKHGDMKVDTPVATMGIRGTAVLVEIDFAVPGQNGAPSANFQVLVEPDGTTGSYILFDKNTLAPLATVNTAGTLTKISQGVVSFQAGSPLTPDEQKLINDLFTTKFGDNNTKNTHHAFTDTPVPQSLEPIKLADGTIVTPIIQLVNNSGSGTPFSSISAPAGLLHIPGAPTVVTFNDAFTEHTLITGSTALDTQTGQVSFADVNAGDLPTVKVEFSSFTYQDAHHNDITQALSPTEQAAIKAVEAISLQQDPGNNNHGTATWTYNFPDKAFDFLGAGETLTLTYTALVNNNFAPSPEIGTQQFTITIVGTNDVPVITSSIPQTIAFVGGTSVPGGDLTAHVPTTGTITFDDPDLTDTHTVSVKLLLDGLDLPPTPLQIFKNALTASIATDSTGTGFGTVNWKLADLPVYLADFIPKGETITLTYEVTVTDSQGTSSEQDITVTITGTDTPAVVWIATTQTGSAPGGLWSDASNWETGTVPTANDDAIIITDQLIGLTPSYPVTITEAAEAKSLTMDNFGTSAPILINQSTLTIGGVFSMTDHAPPDTDSTNKHTPPELDNQGTLTTGGAFDMSADSIVHNSGTISVGGLMEVLDASVLENSGALILRHGGDFKGQSTITNSDTGSIEVSGGTLNAQVDIANDGSIKVDAGATLTIGIATITGGTVTNDGTLALNGVAPSDPSSGAPPVMGEAILKDGTLNNAGVLDAETGAVLEKETVTNTGTIEVLALGALTLDLGTTVDNTGGTIAIDGTGTLTLDDATIDGGTINNYSLPSSPSGSIIPGDIDVTGSSTISNAHLNNGQVTVGANQTLTLDNDTIIGTTFADTASGAVIQIDGGTTLKLDHATIDGGTINDFSTPPSGSVIAGDIDVTGSSTISNAQLNNGRVTIGSNTTLTLSGDTVSGTSFIDTASGATILIDGASTLDGVAITGGTVSNTDATLTVDADQTLTLQGGATVVGGTVDNSGTVAIESASGATLDGVTVTGTGTIQVDGPVPTTSTALVLEDGTTITDGKLKVGPVGVVAVKTAKGATLNDVAVTNDNSIEVFAASVLALASGTVIDNTNGIITIDGTGTLSLNQATIDGGTVNDYSTPPSGSMIAGDIDVTDSSTISNAHLNNGHVTIESNATLTLDGTTVTGTTFADTAEGAIIQIDGGTTLTLDHATINGGTINDFSTPPSGSVIAGDIDVTGSSTISNARLNNGRVTIAANQTLTLDNDTITGTTFADTASGAVIQIDGGTTLKLDHVTIDGGTINDFSTLPSGSMIAGDIDVIGSSTISNAHLNNGHVTIEANQTLTLDGTTVTGTTFADTADGAIIQIDGGTTLTLDHATINGGTINDFSTSPSGSVIAGDIDVTGSSTISNAHLNNGQVTIAANQTLTLDNDTITGTHFVDTADGAVIQIDGGTTLKLDHATIDGGTINDFSTLPSGSMIAGDIDVTGSSTISHAQLNYGNVTIESGLTLTLDGDTVTGTAFTGVATGSIIHVDGGDTLTLNSATVSGGGVTIGADALVKTSGDVTLTNTSVTNDGTIEITGGTLKITGSVASSGPDASGSIKIDSGAVLDLDGSDTQNVVFAGTNGELQIDTSSFGGSISGLAATDEIDLSTIGFGPGTTGTYSGGVLTITDGTHSISMTLTGDYSDAHFAGSSDGHGGTLITLNANDDAPVFDSADTTQIAKVIELADATGSTTSDSSSPASGTIHFTDIDLTDRPTATITQSVTWVSGTTDLSSSLTPTEISALEQAFSLTQSGNTNNGTIGWSYQISDSALDFLGAGETARVTSTVLLDDHQNGHDTATVTVTITGANDAPALAADTSGAAGTDQHAIAELAGQTGDADHDSASGTLSFTDADLSDTHTLSHSGPTYVFSGGTLDTTQIDALMAAGQLTLSEIDSTHSGAGSVSFSYSAPDSSFDFLAEGQTLTVTYSITVTDNSHVSSSQPVTFTITGSNDAPVVDAHNSTLSYTENQAPAAIDAAVTLSDVDSATLGSATVQISGNFVAGEDVLGFIDQNGIHGSYDAVHGILTLTGTSSVANYQAALASVTYFDSSDNPSAAPRTISFSVDDGASANSHSNTSMATVDVTPVNDAPVVTFAAPAHGAIAVPENTATHLSGISVSDVDAGARDITVTLALPDGSSGSLSAGNFDGVTIGGSAIALTITGSLAEINTFLADTRHGVTYTPATGLIHDVTLTVTANDHGATGAGGALDSAPQPVPLDLVPDDLPASHANLIVNGGFETGDFSGWKLGNGTGHAIGINFLVGSEHSENHGSCDMAHHGLKEALFGGIGGDVTLSQSVATNANEHYTVDFWVMNDTSASPGEHGFGGNDFSASWNGVALMPTIVNADKSSGYTEYQFDVTGAAGHSTLEFSARNDDGYWNLDDVSVREGAPDTVNQLTDETTSVSGVHAGDALTVTPADSNSLGMVTAAAGAGTVEWQFAASNAQLDHLMGLTQTYTVSDASNPAVAQTIAVSIGGLGHDQFVFNPGVGADTMVNFSTVSNSQGSYVGDTIELDKFSNIHSISDVLHNLSTDAHGNAVVDLGNHDSITFQGINAATIQANAMHMFVLHSTSGNMA